MTKTKKKTNTKTKTKLNISKESSQTYFLLSQFTLASVLKNSTLWNPDKWFGLTYHHSNQNFYHSILIFAESRVAAMSRAQGWEAGPGQLGKVMGEIRRAMSVTVVRANALCLMERLCQLGPGARAAAQRRQAALHLEERRRQERQAFDLALQARRSSRVERAFIE